MPALSSLAQRSSLDERHGEERHAVGLAGRDHGDDVRVLQARDELNLAMEAIEAHAAGDVGRQQLDHDLAVESPLGGEEDVTHPPATELALDRVVVAERGLESVAKLGHAWGWDESSGITSNDRGVTARQARNRESGIGEKATNGCHPERKRRDAVPTEAVSFRAQRGILKLPIEGPPRDDRGSFASLRMTRL